MLSEKWQRSLAAIWVAHTLTTMGFGFFFSFIPLFIQELGIQDIAEATRWAGAVGGAFALAMALTQPIWGRLSDRWGRKLMVIRSALGSAVLTILTGLVATVEQLLVMRVLQGTVTGVTAASTALVATSMPREKMGFALGAIQMSLFLGLSVGPLVGGIIGDTLGYRTAFYAAGVLMLVATAIVVPFVHEDFVPPPPGRAREGFWPEIRSLMSIRLFPLLVGVIFLAQSANMVVTPVLSLFIAGLGGGEQAATATGLVLAATGAAGAVAALAIGRLSDRVGHGLVVQVCLVGVTLTCVPQALVEHVWELLLLRTLMGVFLGGLMPSANALVAMLVPQERRGAAFGLTSSSLALAQAAGPLFGAGITTLWGMRAVFLATAAIFGLTYGWVLVALRRNPLPRPASPTSNLDATDHPSNR